MDTINGLLWTRDTDGNSVCFAPDAILSAKPNTMTIGEDGGHPVTIVWLKGHRRHTAINASMSDLAMALSDHKDRGPLAYHVRKDKLGEFWKRVDEKREASGAKPNA